MARRLLYSVRSRKHQLLREIQDKTKLLQSVSFYHLCGRKSAPRPPAYSTASSPLTLVKTADSGSCRLQFCGTESLIKSEPFSRVKGKHPFTQRPDFCSETADKCSRMCRHLFQQTPKRAGFPRLCAHVFSRRISAPACFKKDRGFCSLKPRLFCCLFLPGYSPLQRGPASARVQRRSRTRTEDGKPDRAVSGLHAAHPQFFRTKKEPPPDQM